MTKLQFFQIALLCLAVTVFALFMLFFIHGFFLGRESAIHAIQKYYIPSTIIGMCVIIGFALLAFVAVTVIGTEEKYQVFDLNKQNKVTLKDVIITGKLKKGLKTVCDHVSKEEKELLRKASYKSSRGYIFHGPPGTGKTLLARAIAGETNSSFISVAATELLAKFVGENAKNIRDLFKTARENAPCIIFIDEIDAIGRKRSFGNSGHSRANDEAVAQLLAQMNDGENKGVVVIFATNHLDALDPALIRAGRFDEKILIDLPNENLRAKIFDLHMKKGSILSELNLQKVAEETNGFSGADLECLANKLKAHAVDRIYKEQNGKIVTAELTVTMADFDSVFPKFKSELEKLKKESPEPKNEEANVEDVASMLPILKSLLHLAQGHSTGLANA